MLAAAATIDRSVTEYPAVGFTVSNDEGFAIIDAGIADDACKCAVPGAAARRSAVIRKTLAAEDQTAAFKEAQREMQNVASNDMTLLKSAQQRAQKLIEDYVSNLGKNVGKEYYVTWLYVTDDGTNNPDALTSASGTQSESTTAQ